MTRCVEAPRTALSIALLIACAWPCSAAAPLTDRGGPDAQQLEGRWKLHWFNYAKRAVKVDGQFFICDLFDARYRSSLHTTTQREMSQGTKIYRVQEGSNLVREHRVKPNLADVEAYVNALPQLAPGHYGFIHSARVDSIEGPDRMIVSDFWLVDAREVERRKKDLREENRYDRVPTLNEVRQIGGDEDDRRDRERDIERERKQHEKGLEKYVEDAFRGRDHLLELQQSEGFHGRCLVLGVNTRQLRAGARWFGPEEGQAFQVAVVGSMALPSSKKSLTGKPSGRSVPVMVPGSMLKDALDEKEFIELLAYAGLDKPGFIALVTDQLKQSKSPEDAQTQALAALGKALDDARARKAQEAVDAALAQGKEKPRDSASRESGEDAKPPQNKPDAKPDTKPAVDKPLTRYERKKLEEQQAKDKPAPDKPREGEGDDGDKPAGPDQPHDQPRDQPKDKGNDKPTEKPKEKPLTRYEKKKQEEEQRKKNLKDGQDSDAPAGGE